MFLGSVVVIGLVERGGSSEALVLAFGVNDSLVGDTRSGAGVACGTCCGRNTSAQRSNSRQSKKDLARRYRGSSLASSLASLRSGFVLSVLMGSSTSSSTSVSSASSVCKDEYGGAKELSSSADLTSQLLAGMSESGSIVLPFGGEI